MVLPKMQVWMREERTTMGVERPISPQLAWPPVTSCHFLRTCGVSLLHRLIASVGGFNPAVL